MPSATPEELAGAIVDCVKSGARVLNLSAALVQPFSKGVRQLEQALNYVASRGVIAVAAAGNTGTLVTSPITRHPLVIPVAACDLQGRPLSQSNLGSSIGKRGLMAPGEGITSLGTNGKPQTLGGTSAAAPFATGAIALLWSEFPRAPASQIKMAITHSGSVAATSDCASLIGCLGGVSNHELNSSVRGNGVKKESPAKSKAVERQSHRVRLPGFLMEAEVGLGDVIKRVTYALGVKPCGDCQKRAAALNQWMRFTR